MEENELRRRLLQLTAQASRFCVLIQEAREMERDEFVVEMTDLLPRIYCEFAGIGPEDVCLIEPGYYNTYVDDEWSESIKRNIANLLGPDDVYLETFEEDMKYSDTPVAVSIADNLTEIYEELFDFISIVKDSEGEHAEGAFMACRENFVSYWSQTLCNVMRALNHLRFNNNEVV